MQKANSELYMILHEIATFYLTQNTHSTSPSAGTVTSFHNPIASYGDTNA